MSATYRIVRFFQRPNVENEVLIKGISLKEAREHCNDPETRSKTCTDPKKRALTAEYGDWFDGFMEED